MKICWDTLENIYLTRNGTFRRNGTTLIYVEECVCCGDPYLTFKFQPSRFCCRSCSTKGVNNPFYGRTHTKQSKRNISLFRKGRFVDKLNPNYKGGWWYKNVPLYDTYVEKLRVVEYIRRDIENSNILQVMCAYCGKWYIPKRTDVTERVKVINGKMRGEARFYCSGGCKQACPIYGQRKYPKDFKHATSREVDPHLRQMVFERDGWVCQKCDKTTEETELHCHHMDPVAQNLMFQNDMDSCITLCKKCHNEVHLQYGCRYADLRC